MTVNGHWQYELAIPVHIFCVNKDDLRQILFDLWQNGFKLMAQAIRVIGLWIVLVYGAYNWHNSSFAAYIKVSPG